ncbi:cytochrome c family protein [Aurantiacibacter sp. MUD11]|uniref:c-type cytochrome n=1 Tax=Aurantiacibacter sp. MUD11 TaxID=3003265 RepID=UPI0022AB0D7E|nr:cytochrome c family protein [Aurantiacibacter sp. MUD11]WAT16727.1 cytochrome c family protein [Aurantiacibacter sp. MUD11]
MSNTNTIFGWVLFSGIVGLGLTSITSKVFHADNPEVEEFGYIIEAAEEGGVADAGPSLAELLNTGSAEAGAAVFAKCIACHTIEQGGATGIGPNLFGVLGTPIGSHAAGFAYSSALADKGGNWDYENMDAWLSSPRAFANGTKMSFAGLSSAEERANVILYMRDYGGGPDLPAPPAPEAEGEAVDAEDAAAMAAEATDGSENPTAEMSTPE